MATNRTSEDYSNAIAEARRGLEYVRDAKRIPLMGRRGNNNNAYLKIEQAGVALGKALGDLENKPNDGDRLGTANYNTALQETRSLQHEIVGYAASAADRYVKDSEKLVRKLEGLVKHEERGRKFLGVPYAKRPPADSVGRKLEEAKNYVSNAKDRVDTLSELLEKRDLLGAGGTQKILESSGQIDKYLSSITKLETQHQNITPATGKVMGVIKGVPGYAKKTPGYVWGATKHVAGAAGKLISKAPHPHIGGGAKPDEKPKPKNAKKGGSKSEPRRATGRSKITGGL